MPSSKEFEEMYLRYSDKIFRFLYWHTLDPYLAEDLTSEVFLRAWQSWQRFTGDYPQAWLYQIARRLLVDSWRKKKEVSLEAVSEPAYDHDLLEELEQDQKIQRVRKALDVLPENLKAVVILRFMEDYSAKEVAAMLEISEVNVRVLQHRALRKLREVLGHEQI